jgi:hypothetical protein
MRSSHREHVLDTDNGFSQLSDCKVLGTGTFLAIFVGLVQGLGKSSDIVDAMHLQDIGQVRTNQPLEVCLSD